MCLKYCLNSCIDCLGVIRFGEVVIWGWEVLSLIFVVVVEIGGMVLFGVGVRCVIGIELCKFFLLYINMDVKELKYVVDVLSILFGDIIRIFFV